MAFKFIHTADWQIGRAFGRFDRELAHELRLARLDAIDRIADHARALSIQHVLVAGDIWDQDSPTDKTLHATLERLTKASHVTWWLLPGNHDPARPNGLWDRLLKSGVFVIPKNVKAVLAPQPIALEEDVFLLPSPWMSNLPGVDLTTWMDGAETPDGALRIGLAHGAVHGFGDDDEADAEIAATRVDTARLDYLALGDWHGLKHVNARTWYPGTPEPDRFPRNKPGQCLAITLDSQGAEPTVTPLETAQYTWLRSEFSVRPGMTAQDIFAAVFQDGTPHQQMLLQLTLTGRMRPQDQADLNNYVARLADAVAYLEVRADDVQALVEEEDLDRLGDGGSLRRAGEDLLQLAQDQTQSEAKRQDARHALTLLFTFAQDAENASGAG